MGGTQKLYNSQPRFHEPTHVEEYSPTKAFRLEENEPSEKYSDATFYVGDVTDVTKIVGEECPRRTYSKVF